MMFNYYAPKPKPVEQEPCAKCTRKREPECHMTCWSYMQYQRNHGGDKEVCAYLRTVARKGQL